MLWRLAGVALLAAVAVAPSPLTIHQLAHEPNWSIIALLEAGASPDDVALHVPEGKDNDDEAAQATPLLTAALLGKPKLAKLLLDHGAAVEKPDARGKTPLMAAAQSGRWKVMEVLLAAGADAGALDHDGQTALILASRAQPVAWEDETTGSKQIKRCMRLLLEANREVVDHHDFDGFSALFW